MSRRTKTMIGTIAITLVLVTLVGWLTMGFQDFDVRDRFEKTRNTDNLIDVDEIILKTGKHESGLEIDIDNDGVVTLNGTVHEDVSLTYVSLALDPGKYVLSGAEDGSKSTFYLSVEVDGQTVRGDWPGTFEVSDAGNYTVKITVAKDTTLRNVKLYPVLNSGNDAADFWAD